MSQMDPWLAQIYGTGGGDDLEKTAQYHLLQKLAEEEGMDLSGLSDEELEGLYNEVSGGEGEGEYEGEAEQEYLQKEAQAKFEEADFLGRVMAHSYTQELEKIAAKRGKKKPGLLTRASRGTERFGRKYVTDPVGTAGKWVGGQVARGAGAVAKSRVGRSVSRGARAFGGHMARHRGKYGLGGVAAGLGAGGYALAKEASAFEKLAELRAAEMLNAVGVDPSTGQGYDDGGGNGYGGGIDPQMVAQEMARRQQMQQQQQGGQQPQGGGNPQFDDALNQRALEMLGENGYDPEAIAGALG